jgi:competence protein ComGE
MLSRNDGFFLADVLLSLSSWLMAATVLLPMAMFITGQTAALRQENNAAHLLYDHLHQLKLSPELTGQGSISRDGTVFTVIMKQHVVGVPSEVCIEYEDYFRIKKEKCALAE